jgi:CBS domain-containing protein
MICPDCGHDNIPGEELCADCGMPLAASESKGNEVERSISTHTVQVLCPHKPEFVQATASTREVVQHMGELRIGCVMVLDDERFVGIFTERDVLNKITPDLSRLDQPVRDFMTADPESVTKTDSIGYCVQAMALGGYRHLPVVNETGEARGILSVRDILRFLCVRFAQSRT